MPRPRPRSFLRFAVLGLFLLSGCVEELILTDAESRVGLILRVVPDLPPELANTPQSMRIAVADLTVLELATGEPLTEGGVNRDPESRMEALELRMEIPAGEVREVTGTLLLLGEGGGTEWSGRFGPIVVDGSTEEVEIPIAMGRGGLSNLAVTGLEVGYPTGLREGVPALPQVGWSGSEERPELFWSSATPEVLQVQADGSVRGLLPGAGRVTLVAGRVRLEVPVEIVQRVDRIEVLPKESSFSALGETLDLQVRALDPRGEEVHGREMSWSGGGGVLTPVGPGRYTVVGEGVAQLQATLEGVVGSSVVTVVQEITEFEWGPTSLHLTALGEEVLLSVRALDANGYEVLSAQPSFLTTDPSVVEVDSSGRVRALSIGLARVDLHLGDFGAQIPAVVEQVVHQAEIDPSALELVIGETDLLTISATDRNGHPLLLEPPSRWYSAEPAVASVSSGGVVTALTPGVAHIYGQVGSYHASMRVEVLPPPAGDLVFDLTPGVSAPPPTLGGYSMVPVPFPGAPACSRVGPPIPVPGGGLVEVNPAPDGAGCVGWEWATWSHGYTGDIYFTGGALVQTITLPAGTKAFYLYVEPNPFSEETFEVVAQPGNVASGSFTAHGSAGAVYVGVFAPGGGVIESLEVRGSTDFATGTFGWSGGGPIPELPVLSAIPAIQVTSPNPPPALQGVEGGIAVGTAAGTSSSVGTAPTQNARPR